MESKIEFIFNPSDRGYRYSFPISHAEIDQELADALGLTPGLRVFAKQLAEQLGCAGIQIHSIGFTEVMARKESNA